SSPDFDCSATLPALRDSRQRKPSHFGSYSHCAPRGMASTERASIATRGDAASAAFCREAAGTRDMLINANGRRLAGRQRKLFKSRSDRGRDPLLQLLLRRSADLARGHLAALENHQRRDRHYAVARGGLRILVDVELDDLHLV